MALRMSPIRELSEAEDQFETEFYRIKSERLESVLIDKQLQNELLQRKIKNLEGAFGQKNKGRHDLSQETHLKPINCQQVQNQSQESNRTCKQSVVDIQELSKTIRQLKNQNQLQRVNFSSEIKELNQANLYLEKQNQDLSHKNNHYLSQINAHILTISHNQNEINNQILQKQELQKDIEILQKRLEVLQWHHTKNVTENQDIQQISIEKPKMESLRISAISPNRSKMQQMEPIFESEIKQLKNELKMKDQTIMLLTHQLSIMQKQEQAAIKAEATQMRFQKQRLALLQTISKLERSLQEKRQQLERMLTKLKPLLNSQNKIDYVRENAASLTLLEVYLQKYKIKVFDH